MLDDRIMDLLCEGFTLKNISKEVKLSLDGVKKRIKRMKEKYKAKNLTQLAVKYTILQNCHEIL